MFRLVIELLASGSWNVELRNSGLLGFSGLFFHACLSGDRTRGSGSMLLSVDRSGVDILTFEIGMYSCSPGTWCSCD